MAYNTCILNNSFSQIRITIGEAYKTKLHNEINNSTSLIYDFYSE